MARIAIHPGEVLAEDLQALDMSAAELSRQIQLPGTQRFGSDIFSVRARNSGSICKSSMNCVRPKRRPVG
jgi:hypothetical protein